MVEPDVRSTVRDALEVAIERHGIDPVHQPELTTAVVADLIGRPGANTAPIVVSLRAALRHAADGDGVDEIAARRAVEEAGAGADGQATVAALIEVIGGGQHPVGRRTVKLAVAGVAAAAIAAGVVAFLLRPEPDGPTSEESSGFGLDTLPITSTGAATTAAPNTTEADGTAATTSPSSTTAPSSTTTPSATTAPQGITASFQQVREGPFLVERGWRVTPSQQELVGIVRLESPDGGVAVGLHTELPPPSAVTDPLSIEWSIAPARVANAAAVFDLAIEGNQVVEIEYRIALDRTEPIDEAEVLNWYDEWQPLAERLRTPLGVDEEIPPPIIETVGT